MENKGLTLTRRSEGGPLYFVAKRADGFGSRLQALLNAIVAAKCYSGQLALDWSPPIGGLIAEFHDIRSGEETFAQSYLDRFHYRTADFSALTSVVAINVPVDGNAELHLEPDVDAILMLPNLVDTQFRGFSARFPGPHYPAAFASIDFAPALKKAQALAGDVPLNGNEVALHMRSGDIVFGWTRNFGGYTSKIIPFHLAECAIQKLKAQGCTILLFGQDKDVCQHISNKHDITLASDLQGYRGLDDVQKVIFEICLMARCAHILQGSSAFSQVATWIGEVPQLKLSSLVPAQDAIAASREIAKEDPSDVADLQRSFAILYVLLQHKDQISQEDRRLFIDTCLRLDPANPIYKLLKAHFCYTTGAPAEAEKILLQDLAEKRQWGMDKLWADTKPYNAITGYLHDIRTAADDGWPVAALCLAYRALHSNAPDEAKKYADIYLQNRETIRTALDEKIVGLQSK